MSDHRNREDVAEIVQHAIKYDIGRGFNPDRQPVRAVKQKRYRFQRWAATIGTAAIVVAIILAIPFFPSHMRNQSSQSTRATATTTQPSIVAALVLSDRQPLQGSQFRGYNTQGFQFQITASNLEHAPQYFIIPVSSQSTVVNTAGVGGYGLNSTMVTSDDKILYHLLRKKLQELGFEVSNSLDVMYGSPPVKTTLYVKTKHPVQPSSVQLVIVYLEGRGNQRHIVWTKVLSTQGHLKLPAK